MAQPSVTSSKMPSDQRKAQIIDAATQLFATSGYVGTSLRDVAQLCGMTKAALYYHYPDKESLLKSVVETRMNRLNDWMEKAIEECNSDEPLDRIRAFVLGCAAYIDQNRSSWVVGARIFWSIEAIADRTEMVKLRDHFENMLKDEIIRAMDDGVLRREDPGMVTRLLLSWLNYIPRWHKPDGRLSGEEVAEEFLRLSLNGLLVEPGA